MNFGYHGSFRDYPGHFPLKKITLVFIAMFLFSPAQAKDPLLLSNDAWPPFIIKGNKQGTAEELVCQALERSGWPCMVKVSDWDVVLNEARIGVIDGIAAAWRNPERETFLLFSEPYLTNRIIPVVNDENPVTVESLADLSGRRVALVTDYAYGDEITDALSNFNVVSSKNSLGAIRAVRNGEADVALVDELVARDELYKSLMTGLTALDEVLAYRDLHFAISKRHPLAQVIIEDFHRAYKLMLADGTVNEILDVDWLATDFGQSGQMDVVMRSGVSLDDLSDPTDDGSVYALENSNYQAIRRRDFDPSRANYQVEGKSYSTLQSALDDVFGKDTVCKHKNYTSQFDCSDLFKKR
jgi:polar amino acid transport system substrate-binding protein